MLKSLWRLCVAYRFAARVHRGQVDKAGAPYWRHVWRVAWLAYGLTGDVEAAIVGLLHDTVEDGPAGALATYTQVWGRFGWRTAMRVQLLTNRCDAAMTKKDEYDRYLDRLVMGNDPVVHAVKIADLLHNTQPGRGSYRDARAAKYCKGLMNLLALRAAGQEVRSDGRKR